MKKEEIVSYLNRWEAVHKIEVEELRKSSLAERFNQTLTMFALGKSLNLHRKRTNSQVYLIMSRWRQLKEYYKNESGQNKISP